VLEGTELSTLCVAAWLLVCSGPVDLGRDVDVVEVLSAIAVGECEVDRLD
jgi:hypothetical protein